MAEGNPLLPLALRDVSYRTGGQILLDGVDLDIDAPGITMILGANGAGKSTLMRLLHGLIEPSGGSVLCGGESLSRARRMKQAMLFQKPVLLRRSVAANLDFVLRVRGIKDKERREALLARVGLEAMGRRPARRLSGGEQQRLALACALAHEPSILFLDEPTTSLDPASTLRIEEIVLAERARGTKIIGVSHDLAQARRLADDIIFLHRGKLVETGAAQTFFSEPQSEAARSYLSGRIVL